MNLPWKQEAIHTQPRLVNTKLQELEAAKEILAEIFRVRPSDVEEMLQARLEERNTHEACEYGLWPVTFCLGE
jgi:hypothetical protein